MLNRRLRGTSMSASACLDFMGAYFIADIDFRVTYWGCDAQTYGPPERCFPAEAPEYEVDAIFLHEDRAPALGPMFEATGSLFDVLAGCDAVTEAIMEKIAEGPPSRDDY